MKDRIMHTDAHRYNRWPRLSAIAIRWKLYRWFKIWRGIVRTYLVPGRYSAFIDRDWWNDYYTTNDINDAHTVEPGKELYPTLIHYNGVENLILAHLHNNNMSVSGASVLDIGSGAGHWIDFYTKLGAGYVHGIELSANAATALASRFHDNDNITIHNIAANELDMQEKFDVVNAIGVMFHIVNDDEFSQTVTKLLSSLKPGGLLIVGGHFGWLNNLNVQFDSGGRVNKRLRSKRQWRLLLDSCAKVSIYKNKTFRLVNATLPENNILIAQK